MLSMAGYPGGRGMPKLIAAGFDEPTADGLLDALRPDVHCKGTDWTVETVPERAVVEAYGGRIAICGDPKTHSSTELAEKLGEE